MVERESFLPRESREQRPDQPSPRKQYELERAVIYGKKRPEGGRETEESLDNQHRRKRVASHGETQPVEHGIGGVDRPSETDYYAERATKSYTNETPALSPEFRREMLEHRSAEMRESIYTALVAEFEARIEAGQSPADILTNFCNLYVSSSNTHIILRESEKRWIKYRTAVDPEVSVVAGRDVSRPVFTIIDPAVYKQFERIFQHGLVGVSHGLFIADTRTLDKKNGGAGIIIARAHNENIIQHEIFHSIDENNDKRDSGFDQVVSEMFAYFQEYIVKNGEDWLGYENQLINKVYYESYARNVINPQGYGDYIATVRRAIKKIQGMFLKGGAVTTQRALKKAKTITEILQWDTEK